MKTETMVVDSLHKVSTRDNFRILFVTPYENQVRLIFMRIKELIETSPLIKAEVVKNTSNPYMITFRNGAAILGFTTGASSGLIKLVQNKLIEFGERFTANTELMCY